MCFYVWPWNPRISLWKSLIWNIERFLSYLTFYPPKKVALPFIRVEKNTLVCLRSFDSLRTKKIVFICSFDRWRTNIFVTLYFFRLRALWLSKGFRSTSFLQIFATQENMSSCCYWRGLNRTYSLHTGAWVALRSVYTTTEATAAFGRVYGAWAAPGLVYTTEATAASGRVYTTGAWAAPGPFWKQKPVLIFDLSTLAMTNHR